MSNVSTLKQVEPSNGKRTSQLPRQQWKYSGLVHNGRNLFGRPGLSQSEVLGGPDRSEWEPMGPIPMSGLHVSPCVIVLSYLSFIVQVHTLKLKFLPQARSEEYVGSATHFIEMGAVDCRMAQNFELKFVILFFLIT